jgi:hypothetical protein
MFFGFGRSPGEKRLKSSGINNSQQLLYRIRGSVSRFLAGGCCTASVSLLNLHHENAMMETLNKKEEEIRGKRQ